VLAQEEHSMNRRIPAGSLGPSAAALVLLASIHVAGLCTAASAAAVKQSRQLPGDADWRPAFDGKFGAVVPNDLDAGTITVCLRQPCDRWLRPDRLARMAIVLTCDDRVLGAKIFSEGETLASPVLMNFLSPVVFQVVAPGRIYRLTRLRYLHRPGDANLLSRDIDAMVRGGLGETAKIPLGPDAPPTTVELEPRPTLAT
jgi:hypothetical protein